MKLTCPCCGAVASAEAWQNDLEARAVLAAAFLLRSVLQRGHIQIEQVLAAGLNSVR